MSNGNVDELLSKIGQLRKILGVHSVHDNQRTNLKQPTGKIVAPLHINVPAEHTSHLHDSDSPCLSARSLASPSDERAVQLLNEVTFVRVVVHNLQWKTAPDFLAAQFRKSRRGHVAVSPRSRRLFVDYQFPLPESSSGDSQTLKKRVRAASKTVLPTVINFNHRRVALLKVTPELLETWSNAPLWFRIYVDTDGSGTKNQQIGRCYVQLRQLLYPPFGVEKQLPIEHTYGDGSADGYLSVTVQLGSRQQGFQERVDAFIRQYANKRKQSNNNPKSDQSSINGSGQTGSKANSRRPSLTHQKWHFSGTRSSSSDSTGHEHQNGNENHLVPNVPDAIEISHHPTYRSTLARHTSVGLAPRVSLGQRRRPVSHHNTTQSTNVAVQTSTDATIDTEDINQKQDQPAENDRPSGLKSIPAKTVNNNNNESLPKSHTNGWRVQGFVSDRFKHNMPPRMLMLTVHAAYDLPLVKGKRGESQAPSCYVSYRAGETMLTSSTIQQTNNPQWNWSTVVDIPNDRKSLVLKLWNASENSDRDKVLGFVSLDLTQRLPTTGCYDLVDFAQTSTGRLHISLDRIKPSNRSSVKEPEPVERPMESSRAMPLSHVHQVDMDAQLMQHVQTHNHIQQKIIEQDHQCTHPIPLPNSNRTSRELHHQQQQTQTVTARSVDRSVNTSFAPTVHVVRTPSPLYDEYLRSISTEFLQQKLRTNMSELDVLLRRMTNQ